MGQLNQAELDEFEARCQAYLREQFPQISMLSDPAKEVDALRAGIQVAGFRGFTTEVEIVKYLYLRQLLGAGFDASSNSVADILNNLNHEPEARLDLALDFIATGLEPKVVRAVKA